MASAFRKWLVAQLAEVARFVRRARESTRKANRVAPAPAPAPPFFLCRSAHVPPPPADEDWDAETEPEPSPVHYWSAGLTARFSSDASHASHASHASDASSVRWVGNSIFDDRYDQGHAS
jgi:hypothetical protein